VIVITLCGKITVFPYTPTVPENGLRNSRDRPPRRALTTRAQRPRQNDDLKNRPFEPPLRARRRERTRAHLNSTHGSGNNIMAWRSMTVRAQEQLSSRCAHADSSMLHVDDWHSFGAHHCSNTPLLSCSCGLTPHVCWAQPQAMPLFVRMCSAAKHG
jgi:hypothetical protein